MPQGIIIDCTSGDITEAEVPAPASPVPFSITMRQARLALLGAGLLDVVEPAIAALPSPAREAAQIEWEYAAHVRRDNPLIAGLAQALGLDAAKIDALFIAGAGL